MKKQEISLSSLLEKGYTPAQAARAVGRSGGHVRQVINGARKSTTLINALSRLPKRKLVLRRKEDV